MTLGRAWEWRSLPATSESSGLARGLSIKSYLEVPGLLVCTASALQPGAGWLWVPRDRELQGLFSSASAPLPPGLPRTVSYQIPSACRLVPDACRSAAPATEFSPASVCSVRGCWDFAWAANPHPRPHPLPEPWSKRSHSWPAGRQLRGQVNPLL